MENINSLKEDSIEYENVADSSKNTMEIRRMREMREIRSETDEKDEIPIKTDFIVKTTDLIEVDYESDEIKMKICKNVKSIFYKGEIFSSIAHPVDDANSFFIKRNKFGIFNYDLKNLISDYDEEFQTQKKVMVKDQIVELVRKINSIVQIDSISFDLNKFSSFKFFIYLILTISMILLSYYTFLIVIYFISLFVKTYKNKEFNSEILINILLMIFTSYITYVCFKILKHFKLKQLFEIFKYMLNKRNEIRIEIEYFNNTVLFPLDMKAVLSQTFDYIQIMYDMNTNYEMQRHTFINTRNEREIN